MERISWINELYDPSLDVAWSNLQGTLSNGQVIPYADAGISRLGAASLAIGNGTAGDFTGSLVLANLSISGTLTDSASSAGTSNQVLTVSASTGKPVWAVAEVVGAEIKLVVALTPRSSRLPQLLLPQGICTCAQIRHSPTFMTAQRGRRMCSDTTSQNRHPPQSL